MVNEQQNDWDLYVEKACWRIRSSYNESTKLTPYEVIHIRKPKFPSEVLDHDYDPKDIIVQEPDQNEVAEYVSAKQEHLAN